MPPKEEILAGLYQMSNEYWLFATLWHALFFILFMLLLLKQKPSNRLMAIMSSFPLFSVSLFAWISGNPFNGILLLVFGGLLLVEGFKLDRNPITVRNPWFSIPGIMVLIFGLLYPHFLETQSYLTYVYAAPLGIIPCPTLSTVIGLAIIFNGYQSFRWSLWLVLIGLFYGFVGVFRLGVAIDLILLVGTMVLMLEALIERKSGLILKPVTGENV